MEIIHSPESNGFEIRIAIYNKNHKDLSNFFNFDIINLLYMLNRDDIIEKNQTTINKYPDTSGGVGESNIQMLFYHLFKDCGIPQYYLNINMSLDIQEGVLQYTSEVIDDTPDFIEALPPRSRQPKPIPISKMDIKVDIPGPHMAALVISFSMEDIPIGMTQRTRMITMIFKRMFYRLKEFIETMP